METQQTTISWVARATPEVFWGVAGCIVPLGSPAVR